MKVFHQDGARKKRIVVGALALSTLASVLGVAPAAHAVTDTITLTTCSAEVFQDAVTAANTSMVKNVIKLKKNCKYKFSLPAAGSNALPVLADNLKIDGNHASVEGSDDDAWFRFVQTDGWNLAIKDLDIEDFGIATYGFNFSDDLVGGCILNDGGASLSLTNVDMEGCEEFHRSIGLAVTAGGAIASSGSVTLTKSTVEDSEATAINVFGGISVSLAGGIGSLGDVTLKSSTVKGNKVAATSPDAAIALAGGVGVFFGQLTMDKSTVSRNTASARGGQFSLSLAGAGGLGLGPSGDPHVITASTIDGNKATSAGGANAATGGGILNLNKIWGPTDGLTVDVTGTGQTKITNNKASCDDAGCYATGGGYSNTVFGNGGDATFVNTLFKGNVAQADDGTALGGGLFVIGGITDLTGVKVIKNKADGDMDEAGGGLYTFDSNDVVITDSDFDHNSPDDCFSEINPGGAYTCDF